MAAVAQDAADLGVAPGAPAFLFERTTRVSSGRVVEFVRSVYRGDRYRIVVDIFPPSIPPMSAAPTAPVSATPTAPVSAAPTAPPASPAGAPR